MKNNGNSQSLTDFSVPAGEEQDCSAMGRVEGKFERKKEEGWSETQCELIYSLWEGWMGNC